MKLQALFFVAIAFVMWSCGAGGSSSAKKGRVATGAEYIIHTAEAGEKPQIGQYVSFNVVVRSDSTTLEDTRNGGQTPMLEIKEADPLRPDPFMELLQMMAVGDSATLINSLDTIPPEQRHPAFKNSDNMYYDIVVEGIQTAEDFQAEQDAKMAEQKAMAEAAQEELKTLEPMIAETITAYGKGELNDKLTTTDSGLKVMMTKEGTGTQAEAGKTVSVHYYGALTDGTMFDNSFSRGTPIDFPLGQGRVIKGWDEGIALMKAGGQGFLFIPYELAYGEAGRAPTIPEKAELIFYVELEDVK